MSPIDLSTDIIHTLDCSHDVSSETKEDDFNVQDEQVQTIAQENFANQLVLYKSNDDNDPKWHEIVNFAKIVYKKLH